MVSRELLTKDNPVSKKDNSEMDSFFPKEQITSPVLNKEIHTSKGTSCVRGGNPVFKEGILFSRREILKMAIVLSRMDILFS